ncbi:response regulator transcription factor [Peredibacter starrii]|uniref:Response regulator transcription factor n=1 Tax=Peredibacter starrii TaxID=28202 RepID=A0AAX4HK38_9BACT|nr:response regulator transcription factor [Peredibacter starrii]WPU63621.1 response regulator transcription factor [Peredibacter starrii]
MINILVVEDEKKVSAFIQQGLKEVGYEVETAESPGIARELIRSKKFDLLILDVMLPEMSGMDFAKELRANGHNGFILMLTALSTTKDKIQGLDSGADDYLAKPFEFEELLARVRALIRRKSDDKAQLRNGDLIMDLITRNVTRDGIRIELTTKEFSLLEFLMRNQEKVMDRSAIARQVWGADFDPDSNVIDVYINHLRKKIDSPYPKKILKTVVGQGYVLNKID